MTSIVEERRELKVQSVRWVEREEKMEAGSILSYVRCVFLCGNSVLVSGESLGLVLGRIVICLICGSF